VTVDFTRGATDFFELIAGTKIEKYDPELGAVFTIEKETDAPTIASKKYIFFGSLSVITRAAPGTGIVSSIVLQSADLDEIDWEWLGGNKASVQTNYFGKGDTSTYDRSASHPVTNPQDTFYNYTIDWTPDYLRWYIDGAMIREVTYASAKGGSTFPQSPCQVKLGSWVGGKAVNGQGTVDWAGGLTDFTKGPFHAYYKSIVVTDYHKGAASYVWPDVPAGTRGDGSWQKMKVVYGDGSTGTGAGSSSRPASSSVNSTFTSVPTSSRSTAAPTTTPATASTQTNTAAASTSTSPARNAGNTLGYNVISGAVVVLGSMIVSLM
jgi:beta-glucanase (GH16 family)